jgi:hypothetical protein
MTRALLAALALCMVEFACSSGMTPGIGGGGGAGGGGGTGVRPIEPPAAPPPASGDRLPCDLAVILHTNCSSCHGGLVDTPPRLLTYADTHAPDPSDPSRRVWQVMAERVHSTSTTQLMPPYGTFYGVNPLDRLDAWFAAGAPSDDPGVACCQDGLLEAPEECDAPNNFGTATCQSLLPGSTGPLNCSNTCRISVEECKGTTPVCGNGWMEAHEECDGTDMAVHDCRDASAYGFTSGTVACTTGCRIDLSGCMRANGSRCGDGVINGTEQCDGNSVPASCLQFGRLFGTVKCSSGCYFDPSDCFGGCTTLMTPTLPQIICN